MTSPFGKAIVVANTRAGTGKLGRDGQSLNELLQSTGLDFEIHLTGHAGHAVEISREAVESGAKYLIAVGGDGTIHEVVNGIMGPDGPIDREIVVGVIPAGSGSDFIRTFGLPADPTDAARHLSTEAYFDVDVGKLSFVSAGGEQSRYFVNIAEAGLGGSVVKRAERLPRSFGRVRYLLGFWMTLGAFKPTPGKVDLDGRIYEGSVTNLVVANGQFFGGGMRIAPKAHPADGKFDVLIQRGNKRDYIAGITKVYKGEHIPSPAIKEFGARRVEVQTDVPLHVEADGEVLGVTPATFELIPSAYRLKI